jgi:hypothetical protein
MLLTPVDYREGKGTESKYNNEWINIDPNERDSGYTLAKGPFVLYQ